jgi:small subunit ribosomal protein S16
MLSIRLSRIGKKKMPIYSLIVVEKTKDPWGDYTEKLGTFNPHTKVAQFNVERIKYWLGVGAQPTATVHNLLVSQNIMEADKVRAGKSQPGKKRLAEIAGAKKAEEDAIAAKAKAEEDAKAKAEADKLAAEEAAKAPEPVVEAPAEVVETPAEVPAETASEEAKTE